MKVKHNLKVDWDPEFNAWSGSCTCKKWVQLEASKTKLREEFKKHVKE